jgi:hypothetical protein
MSETRMLDFLRALVATERTLAAPSVAPVRLQVRTGFIAPPKEQMRAQHYKVLIWKYAVKNLADFSAFLSKWERDFSDWFHQFSRERNLIDDRDSSRIIIQQSYLGTFPARGAGGAALNRFDTVWGGTLDRLAVIEKCRVAIPSQLTPDEVLLAERLALLFEHVSGGIQVEILDPSIGF